MEYIYKGQVKVVPLCLIFFRKSKGSTLMFYVFFEKTKGSTLTFVTFLAIVFCRPYVLLQKKFFEQIFFLMFYSGSQIRTDARVRRGAEKTCTCVFLPPDYEFFVLDFPPNGLSTNTFFDMAASKHRPASDTITF